METIIIKQEDVVKRMDSHITWIESIYNSIKLPLHYIMDSFTPKLKIINFTN